jgi:hypothetical protein
MTYRNVATSALAAIAVVALPATAQYSETYVYVEEPAYHESLIVVERPFASEDVLITQDVMSELAWDPRLDSSRIAVDTQRNVVSLSGSVTRAGQAALAARDAKGVDGVAEVHNYLRPRVGASGSF